MLRIGWSTNGELDYKRLTLLGDNGYRIPLVREFIRRGDRIVWLGVKPHLSEDPEMVAGIDDFYFIWRMRVAYPGWKASDYFAHVLSLYEEKIGKYLPKLDILVLEPKNFCVDQIAHQAMLLHHYAQCPETVIMIFDADAVFMSDNAATFVPGTDVHLKRLFQELKERVVLMYQSFGLPPDFKHGYSVVEPMFVFFQPIHQKFDVWPNPSPKYDISYIGNDYDRRGMFERFFSKAIPLDPAELKARKSFNRGKAPADKKPLYDMGELPYELQLFGKWDEEYIKDKQFANVEYHGPIDQTLVSLVYYNTLCTLNINRPFYSMTGFTVDRMSEVLQSGSVLLLNDDFYGGEKVVGNPDLLVHGKKDLAEKIQWLRSLTPDQRGAIIEKQLSLFRSFDEKTRVDMMVSYYHKYLGKLKRDRFNFDVKVMDELPWNVDEDAARKKAAEFFIKKAATVDRQKASGKGLVQ